MRKSLLSGVTREDLERLYKVKCPPPRLRSSKGSLTGGKYKSKSDFWSLQMGKKSSLYRLCMLLDPYLKHDKRRKQMSLVWNNIIARGIEEK